MATTIVKIERVKDTYICTNNIGRQCSYNVVTRVPVGFKGKPTKYINDFLYPFSFLVSNSPQKEFIDRLISLGLLSWNNVNSVDPYNYFTHSPAGNWCSALMKDKPTWKKTLERLKGLENREQKSFESLVEDLYEGLLMETLLPAQNFQYINFGYMLGQSCWFTAQVKRCLENDWTSKVLIKWVSKIDSNFKDFDKAYYTLNGHHLNLEKINYGNVHNIYTIIQREVERLYRMIDLKESYPSLIYDETKSVAENFDQWNIDVKILKEAEASERFKQVQTEKDYSFSEGEYTVTVPTSYEDCQKISETFHNCVAHFYWNNYLSKGNRLVVVVNKNGTPAICVGINRNSLNIVDYLKPYNASVKDADDRAFRTSYQNYLKSLL